MGEPSFVHLATRPQVVRTAARVSLVVGSVLVGINHGPGLMTGLSYLGDPIVVGQLSLTYLVPFCVSTYSAVQAARNLPQQG